MKEGKYNLTKKKGGYPVRYPQKEELIKN